MAITFKLPVINADSALVLNTPASATDVVLASGLLSIKDESGATALKIKASDLLGFRTTANAVGTANVVDVQLSTATLIADGIYALTISAPYAQAFFSGGVETNATFQARTYTVGVDDTPNGSELAGLFVAAINADVNAYFSAVVTGGSIVRITADNSGFGGLNVVAPLGATVSDFTPWVSPAGTPAQVLAQVNNAALVIAAGYHTHQIMYRKAIRSNIVNGLEVYKPVTALVYINSSAPETVATVSKLNAILAGTYTPVADYLGCPLV